VVLLILSLPRVNVSQAAVAMTLPLTLACCSRLVPRDLMLEFYDHQAAFPWFIHCVLLLLCEFDLHFASRPVICICPFKSLCFLLTLTQFLDQVEMCLRIFAVVVRRTYPRDNLSECSLRLSRVSAANQFIR
jgi:hypothetical protein